MSAEALAGTVVVPTQLNDEDLAAFQRITKTATGIELADSKRLMIYTRFVRRLRVLGISSFADYITLIERNGSPEYENFVNTITTNLTYFFREPHHFDYLKNTVIPELFNDQSHGSAVRFWSAGCSFGAEPYSIAITLAEAKKIGGKDYRLLCTDIDSDMVAHTASGNYSGADMRGLSNDQISNWFEKDESGAVTAKPSLKAGMICKQLNLFHTWPIRPGIDVIFCRNVLIYFDRKDQDQLLHSFANAQSTGQYLFLGHSESPRGFEKLYTRVSNTVYRRL